jgi:hypothetical protein
MQAPNSGSLNLTGPLTLEGWVKLSSATGSQAVISRFGKGDGGYRLAIVNGKIAFDLITGGQSKLNSLSGNTTLTAGAWHHVAGVFDGTEMHVYLDGVQDGLKKSTVAPASGTAPLEIGATLFAGNLTYQLNGLVDEVRVSTGAIYTTNFCPQAHLTATGATRGLWKFDGSAPNDSSAQGNNGTLNGGATYSTDTPASNCGPVNRPDDSNVRPARVQDAAPSLLSELKIGINEAVRVYWTGL